MTSPGAKSAVCVARPSILRPSTRRVIEKLFRDEATNAKDSALKEYPQQTLPTLVKHLQQAQCVAPEIGAASRRPTDFGLRGSLAGSRRRLASSAPAAAAPNPPRGAARHAAGDIAHRP